MTEVVRIKAVHRNTSRVGAMNMTNETMKSADVEALLSEADVTDVPDEVVTWLATLGRPMAKGIVRVLEAGAGGGEPNAPPNAPPKTPPKDPAKDDDAATARAKARMSAREVRLCAEKKIDPAKYAATRDAIRARSQRTGARRA